MSNNEQMVQNNSRKPLTWVRWVFALLPAIPFVLWGFWLFAVHEPAMFFTSVGALAAICVGGTIYANGGNK